MPLSLVELLIDLLLMIITKEMEMHNPHLREQFEQTESRVLVLENDHYLVA